MSEPRPTRSGQLPPQVLDLPLLTLVLASQAVDLALLPVVLPLAPRQLFPEPLYLVAQPSYPFVAGIVAGQPILVDHTRLMPYLSQKYNPKKWILRGHPLNKDGWSYTGGRCCSLSASRHKRLGDSEATPQSFISSPDSSELTTTRARASTRTKSYQASGSSRSPMSGMLSTSREALIIRSDPTLAAYIAELHDTGHDATGSAESGSPIKVRSCPGGAAQAWRRQRRGDWRAKHLRACIECGPRVAVSDALRRSLST